MLVWTYFSGMSPLTLTINKNGVMLQLNLLSGNTTHLVGLYNDEDVVHTHSQHEEGNDLNDNKC